MKRYALIVVALLTVIEARVYAQQSLSFGVAQTSLNAVAGGAGTIGTYYASPSGGDAALVTWTTVYSAPPASVTMLLEASLDNVSWFTLDTSTAVAGEMRNIATSARFFRCNISAVSGAVNKSCSFVLKRSNAAVSSSGSVFAGNVSSGGQFLAANGTALLPSYSFTSEPTLGFWRSGAANTTHQGALNVAGTVTVTTGNLFIPVASSFIWSGRGGLNASADGVITIRNQANSIGSSLKADALPTIASGFGAGAAITAGSTPFAGSVTVGTTSAAAGVINFNGTAFPSAPFCVTNVQNVVQAVRAQASATQLTITAVSLADNTVISWICVSSK